MGNKNNSEHLKANQVDQNKVMEIGMDMRLVGTKRSKQNAS